MGLASIIISAATKEIAGFTVMGYLTEKAADIGTGKIWTELKKRIGDKPDSFECRLYGAIEKSVGEYLCKGTSEDVSAAICECIFDAWCREGYLTPERIANILRRYSAYAKQNDILAWYRTFQDQIIKDDKNAFSAGQPLCQVHERLPSQSWNHTLTESYSLYKGQYPPGLRCLPEDAYAVLLRDLA